VDDYGFVGDRRFNAQHVVESSERSFKAGCAQAARQTIHGDFHFMDLGRRVGWDENAANDEHAQGEEDSVHRFRASRRCSGYRQ
jgi:transposase-like protein